jgi:hypothetical protein
VLVRGACFGPGGARAFSERAVSEEFFDFSIFVFLKYLVSNA